MATLGTVAVAIGSSVAGGVITSLIQYISSRAMGGYVSTDDLDAGLESLRNKLRGMNSDLEFLADVEDLDTETKIWRNKVRDLSYDTEDIIFEIIQRTSGDDQNDPNFCIPFIDYCKDLIERCRSGEDINQMIRSLKETENQRGNYIPENPTHPYSRVPLDPRVQGLENDISSIVGISEQRDNLVQMLKNDAPHEHLKVVSVVGTGGLGKTTLASVVYENLSTLLQDQKFGFQAFVSISQRHDIKPSLHLMIKKLKGSSGRKDKEEDLINKLNDLLIGKTYFIVVDDVWHTSQWDSIKRAFPHNSESRIVVTTRMRPLGLYCSRDELQHVYEMKPLELLYSRKLFVERVFGSEDDFPQDLEPDLKVILTKCAGIPLAVNIVAGFLASHNEEMKHWNSIKKSLSNIPDDFSEMKKMSHIINLSYAHLPQRLRTCFLHLGRYPEDKVMEKDDLVKQWVAEGFVSNRRSGDPVDVATSYFNELVNRSMVHPIFTNHKYEVLTCKLHDLMLDFIITKSAEENFIAVMHDSDSGGKDEDEDCSTKAVCRRLSFHSRKDASVTAKSILEKVYFKNMNLGKVRSLTVLCGCVDGLFPRLKFIRVLVIENFTGNMVKGMDEICKLFQLRYLKIGFPYNLMKIEVKLPATISNLKCLQTLDVADLLCASIDAEDGSRKGIDLPEDIVLLPKMRDLVVKTGTKLPDGIGGMQSLRRIYTFDVFESSVACISGLGALTSLRDLRIILKADSYTDEKAKAILSSLQNLAAGELNYLYVSSYHDVDDSFYDEFCGLEHFPVHLVKLHLYDYVPYLPEWISQLQALEDIELTGVYNFDVEDMDILGQLPSLLYLEVQIKTLLEQAIVIHHGNQVFRVLKYFKVVCMPPWLAFEEGAMKMLKKLELGFHQLRWAKQKKKPDGITYLAKLQAFTISIGRGSPKDKEAAISELRGVINSHGNHPRFDIDIPEYPFSFDPEEDVDDTDNNI